MNETIKLTSKEIGTLGANLGQDSARLIPALLLSFVFLTISMNFVDVPILRMALAFFGLAVGFMYGPFIYGLYCMKKIASDYSPEVANAVSHKIRYFVNSEKLEGPGIDLENIYTEIHGPRN